MRKLIDIGSARRILAVLVVIALLLNVSLFAPATPMSSDRVYGENGSGQSLRELYADIPNGTVMPDGNVLLYYSLWDFEARYQNALYYDNFFDPEIVPLPFETDEAREAFLAGYRGDTWYLLDVVYSMRLMPAPGSNPSEEETEALMAASSFAYVVKSKESGTVSVILSTKNGEEFQIHIEADEDGEALSATLVLFEEEVTLTEIEEEEAIEEEVPEEDALVEEGAAEEDAAAEEEKPAEPPKNPVEENPPAEDEAAPAENPSSDESKTEEESPAASEDANENNGANDANTEEAAAPSEETPAAPAEESPSEPASSGESSESESGIISALLGFFITPVYAADIDDATEENSANEPAAIEPEAPVNTEPAPEAKADDKTDEESAPAEESDESKPEAPAEEENAPAEESGEAVTEEPAPAGESDEAKQVIVEVSLNETKEVLAGFAEVLEETIAAKPLAALEITPRHFAAAGSADVSSALFSKQSAGLGDALKSAFSSVSAAEVYGADGYEENIAGIEHFPVNLYDYMGTLANIGSQSPNPRPGNNRFNTQYHNFNTPAMLMFGNANSYSTTTNYTYGSYSIKSYFLFNQPQVVYSNGNTWTNFNNNASDNSGNNAGNRHGNQNRVEASDFSAGITQDIAKSKLNNGAFEINFATMNGLGLFPEIKTEPQGFNPVYIYGKSDGTADQKAIGDQFSAKKSNGDPGMIQAYPNRGLPFVKDSDGYYSFDSARERVYLQTGSKRLGRTAAADNGFFPFNANGVAANTNSESYNFGMSMNIDFVMPKDGKVTGNDMVFEFVGDDDLWVYIDGQLVLDLGGIHGAESGTINFNKKTVTTLNNAHTIRTLTPGAPYTGASTSVTGPDTKNFSAINSAFANSFNDYSMHTLQLFYMERNPTGSNCKITFNLQSIEPDKLNVFKYADENTSDTEKFGFDVYVSESKTKPGNTEGTLLAETSDANIITQNVKYVNDDLKALALTKDDRFALDIPDKYKWVRVVERPKLTDGETGEERFSTVFLGNGINESGKDSGWMSINKEGEVKTNALFCFNYAQHPITLTKFRLDGATWDTKGTTETNDDIIKYYEMETVTFNLYEVEADGKTPKTDPVENGVVTTDDKGQITLNKPGDNTTPKLKPNTKYVLVEQNTDATKNYERTPIYFETTQGVSALVKKIWYYDAAGNEVNYSGKLDETGYGQIVFADATGRHIELYNKRLTGSVRVEKTLKDIQNVNFDAQGDPIFLFKLEKLEKLDSGEYKVIGTQSTSVRFGSEYTLNADETSATMPSTFDNLEAGYYYRISELDTMRYDLVQNGVKLTIGGTEQSGGTGNSTPVFELTDTIITNQTEITASFANTRTYPDYLSDTDVAVNTFTYTPPWPAPSAPVVYEVHIYKSNNNTNEPTVKKFVTQGDLIDISNSSNGIGIYMGTPDTDGAIGRSGNRNNGAKFYPYTPITSGLITDNSNIVKLYLN